MIYGLILAEARARSLTARLSFHQPELSVHIRCKHHFCKKHLGSADWAALSTFHLKQIQSCCASSPRRWMSGGGYGHLTFCEPFSASFKKNKNTSQPLLLEYLDLLYLSFHSFCPFNLFLLSPLFFLPSAYNAIDIPSCKSKCLSLPQGSGLSLLLHRSA